MPSVRGHVGRELGWRACHGDSCLARPCCGSRCLPAGLLGCLGHLWARISGRQAGSVDAQEGVKGTTESGRQNQKFSSIYVLLPPLTVCLCVFNDVHKMKAAHAASDKHAHGT